jgi:hypothetical protein
VLLLLPIRLPVLCSSAWQTAVEALFVFDEPRERLQGKHLLTNSTPLVPFWDWLVLQSNLRNGERLWQNDFQTAVAET